MNPPPSPIAAIDASVVTPLSDLGRERPEPRRRAAARRFLARADVGLTGIMILLGATILSAFVIFVVSLATIEAIAVARGVLGAGVHPGVPVRWLVGFSLVGGLLPAVVACAAFLNDLRRQHWL